MTTVLSETKLTCPSPGCPESFDSITKCKRHIHHQHRKEASALNAHQSQIATDSEFHRMVASLKEAVRLVLRGKEAKRRAVGIAKEFQERFGDSRAELKLLCKEVGVHVSTMYKWMNEVEWIDKIGQETLDEFESRGHKLTANNLALLHRVRVAHPHDSPKQIVERALNLRSALAEQKSREPQPPVVNLDILNAAEKLFAAGYKVSAKDFDEAVVKKAKLWFHECLLAARSAIEKRTNR